MNRFLSLFQLAIQNQWCMTPSCTTCGTRDFTNALRQFGAELADHLANVDLSELEMASDWEGALRLSLDEIQTANLMDRVLLMWLPQLERHIRLADLVLFYYVRRGALFAPMSIGVLQQWKAKCIDLAIHTGDESLVESLICTLGKNSERGELDTVVRDLVAQGSRRVSLALKRQST
jgi:hypothetical protein